MKLLSSQTLKRLAAAAASVVMAAVVLSGCSEIPIINFGSSEVLWKTSTTYYNGTCEGISGYDEDGAVPSGSISIPSTLGGKEIGVIYSYALRNCETITSVTIPSSIRSIGHAAFENCTGLCSVTFEEGSTALNISYDVFKGCTSLTTVKLPHRLERKIDGSTFKGCTSLKSIYIPKSVTYIGSCAFDGCKNLKDVYYEGSQAEWAEVYISNDNTYLNNANIHFNSY